MTNLTDNFLDTKKIFQIKYFPVTKLHSLKIMKLGPGSDDSEISEIFNNFFCNVVVKLDLEMERKTTLIRLDVKNVTDNKRFLYMEDHETIFFR